MKPFVVFLFALVLASVQAALLRSLGGGAVALALALPIVIYLGLHGGNVEGAGGGVRVGYVVDLMAGGPKGLMTFLAVALFLCSRLAGAALSVQGKIGFAVLSFAGTFFYGAAALLLPRVGAPVESAPSFSLLGRILVEALLTGLISPVVLGAMRRVE